MRFEAPFLLILLPVIAATIGILAWWGRRARVRLAQAWSAALGLDAIGHGRHTVLWLTAAGGLIGLGLAAPRGGVVEQEASARSLNLVFAIDISRSMLAEDVSPNRLGRAVQEARRLSQDLAEDRVGLIGFAGHSYILTPLTLDHAAVDLYLSALDPDLASEGGTHLAAALQQGRQVLGASLDGGDRALVVITDGEAHDTLDASVAAAQRLRDDGIMVVVVGVGGNTPVRIPLRDATGRLSGYQLTPEGETIETARQDGVLRRIAQVAGGVYVSPDVVNQSGAVSRVLGDLARRPSSERRMRDRRPLAWVTALLAGLILLGHTVTRRGTALVVLALVSWVGGLKAQRPAKGVTQSDRGDFNRAEVTFRRHASRGGGPSSDTAWYNAGTAALNAGRLADAREALDRAARSLDPDLRFRALYNVGVAALLDAQRLPKARDSLERVAAARLREALLIRPGAERAKWNLELAMRHWKQPPPPTGGGGNPPPPPPRGDGEDKPQPQAGGLSPAEAEAILSSVERGETATRAEQAQRRRNAQARVVKDW